MLSTILRNKSVFKSLTALLLVLTAVIALHRFEPAGLSQLGGRLLRSLHGPGFSAIAIAVSCGLRGWASGWSRIGLALIVCLAISLLAELSQVPGPRNAEISDLVVDGAGIVAGLGLIAALDLRLYFGASPWTRRAVTLASTIALAVILFPTLWLTAAAASRNASLPVLLSFESPLERELYAGMKTPPARVAAPADWPSDGSMIGHATATGRWGTMLALAPYQDWHSYEAVSLLISSASDELVDVSIMLRSNTNYYTRFTVGREPQRMRIALDEVRAKKPDFDFSNVRALIISAANPGEPLEVLLDDLRLEN